jgi:hypothetical protein
MNSLLKILISGLGYLAVAIVAIKMLKDVVFVDFGKR